MTPPLTPRSQPLTTILFDLDGTLVHSLDLIVASFQHATSTLLGYAVAREWVLPTVGRPLLGVLEELAPGQGAALLAHYREFNHAHHDDLIRLPLGTHAMLDAVRARDLHTGLVTAKALDIAALALVRFRLEPYLDVLVTQEKTTLHKPDPAPVLFACAALGVAPATACMVGDSIYDMEAAQRAGATALGVDWGADSPARLLAAGATHILPDWAALISWLDEQAGA